MPSSADLPAHRPLAHPAPSRRPRAGSCSPVRRRWAKAVAVAAAAAAVASSAIAGTVAAQPSQRFQDLPRTHYAYEPIEWAVENAITQGCGDGRNFCPDDTLSRAHMVTLLKRYHDKFHSSTSTTTTTIPARASVRVRGSGSGILEPAGSLTAGSYRGTLSLLLRGASGTHEGILEFTQVKVSVVDSDGLTNVLHTEKINLADYDAAARRLTTEDAPITLTAPFSFRVGDNLNDIVPGTADIKVEITDRTCTATDGSPCPQDATDANSRFRRSVVASTRWEVVLSPR